MNKTYDKNGHVFKMVLLCSGLLASGGIMGSQGTLSSKRLAKEKRFSFLLGKM